MIGIVEVPNTFRPLTIEVLIRFRIGRDASDWCERLKLSKIQVYLAGDHLYVFNARRGLNSNYSLSNYDSGGDRFSPSRTISLGINITL